MATAVDLNEYVDYSNLECLNQKPSNPIANALKQGYREDDGLWTESDTGEQAREVGLAPRFHAPAAVPAALTMRPCHWPRQRSACSSASQLLARHVARPAHAECESHAGAWLLGSELMAHMHACCMPLPPADEQLLINIHFNQKVQRQCRGVAKAPCMIRCMPARHGTCQRWHGRLAQSMASYSHMAPLSTVLCVQCSCANRATHVGRGCRPSYSPSSLRARRMLGPGGSSSMQTRYPWASVMWTVRPVHR
jgi:hypothetical protein